VGLAVEAEVETTIPPSMWVVLQPLAKVLLAEMGLTRGLAEEWELEEVALAPLELTQPAQLWVPLGG